MSEIKDGGPAFPTTPANGYGSMSTGISMRDWFAAQALAGMLSNEDDAGGFYQPDTAAERAYQMADAMLAAREPQQIITEDQP